MQFGFIWLGDIACGSCCGTGTPDTKTFPDQGKYVQTQSNSQNDATSKQQALSVERDMNRYMWVF